MYIDSLHIIILCKRFYEGGIHLLKIIIAPDSFKGSLSAIQAAEAMAEGVREARPDAELLLLPAADGGEGTMENLIAATAGKTVTSLVKDPLGRSINARFGVLGDGETCVVELAEASGLMLLAHTERDPLAASTYGTGELIRHALDAGYRNFIIGLGGSATNDGGSGMLQALGMKFFGPDNKEFNANGGALGNLREIDDSGFDPRIAESRFLIASDVENPFVGYQGASAVFGPQKGATPELVELLDNNLLNFANVIERKTGFSLHAKKGSGAAGGAGGAFQVFFSGEMKRGIDVVLEAIHFEEHSASADLIITGEGKTDEQTLSGKTPYGIAEVALKHEKPVLLISGVVDEDAKELLLPHFTEVHSVVGKTVSSEESIVQPAFHLSMKTKEVIEAYFKNYKKGV
jgi:glycerate 2-kinase